IPTSPDEKVAAATLRAKVWEGALHDVEQYAAQKKAAATPGERWYDQLTPSAELRRVNPFPALPPIYDVLPEHSTVAAESMESAQYGYQRDTNIWRVNDRFLLELAKAYGDSVPTVRQLVRMFMFHESLHVAHGITKAKVEE